MTISSVHYVSCLISLPKSRLTLRIKHSYEEQARAYHINLEEKEEIWLGPITNAPTATEKSKNQRDNTTPPPPKKKLR